MSCSCIILACDVFLEYKYMQTGDFVSAPRSGTGQAKPIVLEESRGVYIRHQCGRGCIVSLLWTWDQDGPLRISTINAVAAQVSCE
jgi:hypothetical protein